jgi:two-component system CheB/CheR fusion protein
MLNENEAPDNSVAGNSANGNSANGDSATGNAPQAEDFSFLASGSPMVVAIGASAGGVEALQKLFSTMPAETGLSFVVILHTAAELDSHLAEIIQRRTPIPVAAVRGSAKLRTNHIYCLPSDREVELLDGEVLVTERLLDDQRVPIDLFFRSVAARYRERAITIILSGTGSDGSLGIGRVREEGGVNIVQDPEEAEYSPMPRSAIEQGSVDFILPLEQIPEKLVSLRRNAVRIQMPPVDEPAQTSDNTLVEILALLRTRTRHE